MSKMRTAMIVCVTFAFAISLLCSGPAGAQTKTQAKPPAKAPVSAKIDLNKATLEQLSRCPGLNSVLAKAIVEYREKSGPFKKPEDLLKVKGITKELLNKLNPKIEKDTFYITPASSSDEDEEEPSLKPSKC